MGTELSKLLGRDFFIGFFLPALFFLTGNWLLLRYVTGEPLYPEVDANAIGESALVTGLVVWIFAIFLQALNRQLFRFAEGYWPKRNWFIRSQRRRFRYMHSELERLKGARKIAVEQRVPFTEMQKLITCWRTSVLRFPSEECRILPTSFGNTVCAYEDYSRVIYGFESTNGWCRIQGFFSKAFREVLGQDRSRVDLWLNLWWLSVAMAIEAAVTSYWCSRLPATAEPQISCSSMLWLSLLLFAMAILAYRQARSSAEQFGEQVKAAFDLYLPVLAKSLGYSLSSDQQRNRSFWKAFSQMTVYHQPESLDAMALVGLIRVAAPEAAPETPSDKSDEDEDGDD
jgi:hypothetical protein